MKAARGKRGLRVQPPGALGSRPLEITDRPMPTIGAMAPTDVYLDLAEHDAASNGRRDPGKPPYRTPTLADVLAAEPNGLTCVSTFSGCGGSSTGYRLAGYRVLAAVDLDEIACASYRANYPDTAVLERDARELTGRQLMRAAGVRKGELDLLDGSPPCTPFSVAGRRQRTWGRERPHAGKRQRVDDLFLEFARLLGETKPRAFVAENVAGLARGVSVGYFKTIRAALAEQGYHVEVRLLDAQWMGVPQARQRLIFAGVRVDTWKRLALERIPYPAPLSYRYSVREALPWLDPAAAVVATRGTPWGSPEAVARGTATPTEVELDDDEPARAISAGEHAFGGSQGQEIRVMRLTHDTGGQNQTAGDRDRIDEPAQSITFAGGGASHHFQIEARIGATSGGDFDKQKATTRDLDQPAPTLPAQPTGNHRRDLTGTVEMRVEHDTGGKGRDAHDITDAPAPTVALGTAQPGEGGGVRNHFKVVREDEHGVTLKRKFTIPEVKRLFAFPDDYRLEGGYAQQWAQLGNSVCPPMARAMGEALAPLLKT